MKINEEITISAEPSDIWPFLAVPEGMAVWNPKITSIERQSKEPVHLGERYGVTFTMSGRARPAIVEVVVCKPPSILTLRYEATDALRAGFAEETFTLTPCGSTTRVRQTIAFGSGTIPWFIKPIIWWLHQFGRPAEESYLSRLQRLVEGFTSSLAPK